MSCINVPKCSGLVFKSLNILCSQVFKRKYHNPVERCQLMASKHKVHTWQQRQDANIGYKVGDEQLQVIKFLLKHNIYRFILRSAPFYSIKTRHMCDRTSSTQSPLCLIFQSHFTDRAFWRGEDHVMRLKASSYKLGLRLRLLLHFKTTLFIQIISQLTSVMLSAQQQRASINKYALK